MLSGKISPFLPRDYFQKPSWGPRLARTCQRPSENIRPCKQTPPNAAWTPFLGLSSPGLLWKRSPEHKRTLKLILIAGDSGDINSLSLSLRKLISLSHTNTHTHTRCTWKHNQFTPCLSFFHLVRSVLQRSIFSPFFSTSKFLLAPCDTFSPSPNDPQPIRKEARRLCGA